MLTITDKKFFLNIIKELEKNEKIFEMKKYIQHGNISTFDHCFYVSYTCYRFAKNRNMNVNYEALIRGAFLHDFYLYDWHEKSPFHRLHGFTHPYQAYKNAKLYFDNISKLEENMITSHMWPLTLRHIPKYKESIILTLVDKYCSTLETFKYSYKK